MKKILISISAVLTLLTISNQQAFAAVQLDGIAVVVNEEVITLRELDYRVNDFAKQLSVNPTSSSDFAALKKQVLEHLIQNRIQLQQAVKLGITIDDVSLNRVLGALAESNNLSLDQLRDRIQEEGMDFTRFREQSREDLIIKQLQKRLVADKITVSEQEIKQFVSTSQQSSQSSRYHVNHILIATPQTARPDDIKIAKKKAEQVYTSLIDGGDFQDTAIKQSDGRNALQGGDLGWRESSELPESFVEALREMKVGDISKPIRSASGFHIIKLVDSSSSNQMVEQTHARHILIRTSPELDDDGARDLLIELKRKITNGADFGKLATEHSQDPGSKELGGDLGWADPGTFVDAFEDTMATLKPGEISAPFQSQFGWHLMQVLERRQQNQTSTSLEAQARKQIRKRKTDEELRLWLRRIRDEAFVEYVDASITPPATRQDE